MKYVITAAVAALALVVTAGSASAQHGGGHGGPRFAPAHHPVAPVHHPVAPGHHGVRVPLGHAGYPAAGFGVGVSVGPVFGGVGGHPAPVHGPALAPAHGYRTVPQYHSHH